MVLPDESTYKKLAKALEPLELAGKLRYLPDFEDCGSCAGAAISDGDWGDFEFVATFNEQSKESADDFGELWLSSRMLAGGSSEQDSDDLLEAALLAGGFEKVPAPESGRGMHSRNFRFNVFFRTEFSIVLWGWFDGKAKPTKAVREATKSRGDLV